jgi:hypothetical protein
MGRTVGAVLASSMAGVAIKFGLKAAWEAFFPPKDDDDEDDREDFWDTYAGKVLDDQMRNLPFISNAAALAIHQRTGSVIIDEVLDFGARLAKYKNAKASAEKPEASETTIEKAELRMQKEFIDGLFTAVEWGVPGAGAWRAILNEQIKEMMLDFYDTIIDNVDGED